MKTKIVIILSLTLVIHAYSGSATWSLNPTSNDWNTAANWTPPTVPNATTDTATFGASNTTSVSSSAGIDLAGLVFTPGAPSYTIDMDLAFWGDGVRNDSGVEQTFTGGFSFYGNSSAGDNVSYDGSVYFLDNGSAGNSTLIAENGPGGDSGGVIWFQGIASGGTARVVLLGPTGPGTLELNGSFNGDVTVGSIEGSGLVTFGLFFRKTLTIGSNNLSTTFSGLIQDGTSVGAIAKIGTGTLTLSGANTYSGGTTITSGILLVSNVSGSGTGTRDVKVNAGTLGGSGIIAGGVTVGTNTGVQAFLAPSKGVKKPATLTIQGAVTLNDDSTYIYKLNTERARADEVIANGVTIDSGAKFSFRPTGTSTLTIGQVFTVINNTAGSPIVGTFHNLADGAIISINGNNLQADYQGGDGNDLTLTVVP